MRGTIIAVALASGCTSRTTDVQHVEAATLRFDVPADWERADTKARDVMTSVWTPRDNDRKQTVAVVRSEGNPAVANAGAATLERLLVAAQAALPRARTSTITPITSQRGLSGVRVEIDFVPEGATAHYRRVHAVLVDGTTLVNVLYTAKNPDLDAFNVVLNSIRHEEG